MTGERDQCPSGNWQAGQVSGVGAVGSDRPSWSKAVNHSWALGNSRFLAAFSRPQTRCVRGVSLLWMQLCLWNVCPCTAAALEDLKPNGVGGCTFGTL